MKKNTTRITRTMAAVTTAVTLAGCGAISTTGAAKTSTPPKPALTTTTPAAVPTTTTTAVSPYSSNGMWLVPKDVEFGTYIAKQTTERVPGYVAICTTITCVVGDGLLRYLYVSGQRYIEVDRSDGVVAIILNGTSLTRVDLPTQ